MAQHLILQLMIQAHKSHQENFGSRALEDQEVCSVNLKRFKVDKITCCLVCLFQLPKL